jgi:hypothetical protein
MRIRFKSIPVPENGIPNRYPTSVYLFIPYRHHITGIIFSVAKEKPILVSPSLGVWGSTGGWDAQPDPQRMIAINRRMRFRIVISTRKIQKSLERLKRKRMILF